MVEVLVSEFLSAKGFLSTDRFIQDTERSLLHRGDRTSHGCLGTQFQI